MRTRAARVREGGFHPGLGGEAQGSVLGSQAPLSTPSPAPLPLEGYCWTLLQCTGKLIHGHLLSTARQNSAVRATHPSPSQLGLKLAMPPACLLPHTLAVDF